MVGTSILDKCIKYRWVPTDYQNTCTVGTSILDENSYSGSSCSVGTERKTSCHRIPARLVLVFGGYIYGWWRSTCILGTSILNFQNTYIVVFLYECLDMYRIYTNTDPLEVKRPPPEYLHGWYKYSSFMKIDSGKILAVRASSLGTERTTTRIPARWVLVFCDYICIYIFGDIFWTWDYIVSPPEYLHGWY